MTVERDKWLPPEGLVDDYLRRIGGRALIVEDENPQLTRQLEQWQQQQGEQHD